MRTLKEIEEEIDRNVPLGNIGRVMDLVDEHGNTIDKMYQAIIDGDLEQAIKLTELGMNLIEEQFVKAAILHDQLHEPPRLLRRLFSLRGLSYEEVEQVLARSP